MNLRKIIREAFDELSQIDKIDRAREMAIIAHGEQLYGNRPYIYHLEKVVQVARELGYSDEIIIACYLHDTLEDTNLTKEEIASEFGNHIANVVYAVKDEEGESRKERKAKTYPKIASISDAIAVKLCDRIANVEESSDKNPRLFKMYIKEQPGFELALRGSGHEKAWERLDSLF